MNQEVPVHDLKNLFSAGIALLIASPFVVYLLRHNRKLERERRERERELKADREWEKNPDPVAVQVQRELFEAGEFRRNVIGWTPSGLKSDRAKLSCGHSVDRAMGNHYESELNCYTCAREYLKNARPK